MTRGRRSDHFQWNMDVFLSYLVSNGRFNRSDAHIENEGECYGCNIFCYIFIQINSPCMSPPLLPFYYIANKTRNESSIRSDDGVYVLLSTGSNFTSPVLEVNDFGAHLDINCLLEVGI